MKISRLLLLLVVLPIGGVALAAGELTPKGGQATCTQSAVRIGAGGSAGITTRWCGMSTNGTWFVGASTIGPNGGGNGIEVQANSAFCDNSSVNAWYCATASGSTTINWTGIAP